MNRNRFAIVLTVIGVMAAFAVAPGASGSQCTERSGHACHYGDTGAKRALPPDDRPESPAPQRPALPPDDRPESPAPQRLRLQPLTSRDRNGNPVWRAGNHALY